MKSKVVDAAVFAGHARVHVGGAQQSGAPRATCMESLDKWKQQ